MHTNPSIASIIYYLFHSSSRLWSRISRYIPLGIPVWVFGYYILICECRYVAICVCMYVECMYVCMYVCMHACTYIGKSLPSTRCTNSNKSTFGACRPQGKESKGTWFSPGIIWCIISKKVSLLFFFYKQKGRDETRRSQYHKNLLLPKSLHSSIGGQKLPWVNAYIRMIGHK